ncbi:GNAT family N-acetyltransferase [Aminicella lysinilytica]|uniref:Quinol monooxygenase YgiN n=1 Tax=Aminicella lysinilytica TaxID=433323 RepID=A0A4R6PYC0_9FIRM|nr:GNAT family N-acetyltransferase [Aminicella lysinilytica]TDP51396.1 quinol monooxygenase YgiN [Aminicella lysinilytica]
MLIIDVKYTVKPGMRQDFYNAIMNNGIAETSRHEAGNHKYDYSFPKDEADVLELKEIWEDAETQKAHTETDNFRKLGKLKETFVLSTELHKLTARLATPADLGRVAEIEAEAFPPSEAASLEKYTWRLAHYPEYFFVGEQDGVIEAVVDIIPTAKDVIKDDIFEMDELPAGKNAAVLTVMTSADCRRQGMAGQLLSYAVDEMKARGMTESCLTCKDRLIHYYAKFGFEKVGVSESVHGGAIWYDMVRKL